MGKIAYFYKHTLIFLSMKITLTDVQKEKISATGDCCYKAHY